MAITLALITTSSLSNSISKTFPSNLNKSTFFSTFNPNPAQKPNKNHQIYHKLSQPTKMAEFLTAKSSPTDLVAPLSGAINLVQSNLATWQSAVLSNVVIFVLGSPILVSGLSISGIAAAFLLGTLTWRSFGPPGFLLVATYFVFGTLATKVKMAQKEAEGVAEKKKGRRGPGSVIGSSAAGCVCAILSIYGIGGKELSQLWKLGFVASFCTKLSDTVSSEIGKAYGKTTYLVTTFKVVSRGTEGAVSVEGTIAGLLASILLAIVGCLNGQINLTGAVVCILASQIANFSESIIGALFQEKEGFQWLNNDAVNIINISMGSILAILFQQVLNRSWL
ncbi:protein VTE6, chloroplastic-like [Chenopodium quinoa]|uniref:protein VTE6, chloroplastic-like n=1 Tax=Chenopodium quinoa TaxID=63459 RepID=UPI000B796123|nr:protein VTE6, chloroplastic-like [Chenopodium quinoa]XP_021736210.1 protein VTE6, chloroplastic-like [Chenopodium quinoa]